MGAVGLALLFLIPSIKSSYAKAVAAASVLSTGLFVRTLSRGEQRSAAAASDVRGVSDFARTQLLYQEMLPGSAPPDFPSPVQWTPPDFFDLSNLRDTTHYPHILVVGATGDGKSTLVEWIVDEYQDTQRLYVSPTRDDFEFIDYQTYGCGVRPDGSPYNMRFQEISNILQALLVEVSQRYNMPAAQALERGFINAVLDEYRLTAKVGASDGTESLQLEHPETGNPMSYSEAVMFLATVARKRFIRVWLLLQSETVKALDMAGEGDVRESFTWLRLGSFARNHLKSLISAKVYPPEALIWWDNQPPHKLAMVNDHICLLPNLAQYQQGKARNAGFQGVKYNTQVRPMSLPRTTTVLQRNTVIQGDGEEEPGAQQLSLFGEPPPTPSSSPSVPPENPKPLENTTFHRFDEITSEIGLKKVETARRLGIKPGNNKEYKKFEEEWSLYLLGKASQGLGFGTTPPVLPSP